MPPPIKNHPSCHLKVPQVITSPVHLDLWRFRLKTSLRVVESLSRCHAFIDHQPTNIKCESPRVKVNGLAVFDEATKRQDFQRRNPSFLGKTCRHCLPMSRLVQLEVGVWNVHGKVKLTTKPYHYDTNHTVSLVDFVCPKNESGPQQYLFELKQKTPPPKKNKSLFRTRCLIKDHRPKWSSKVERL